MSGERIRIAIQKSGRLTQKSVDLLTKCGVEFEWRKETLFSKAENFPLDLMFVRDDDIPSYVSDGVCDLGIVGLNVRVPGRADHGLLRPSPIDHAGTSGVVHVGVPRSAARSSEGHHPPRHQALQRSGNAPGRQACSQDH